MSNTIHAVHDDDLEKFLISINSLEKMNSGKIKCSFCKVEINMNILSSIFPESGDIKFSCNKPECVIALKTKIEGNKYG